MRVFAAVELSPTAQQAIDASSPPCVGTLRSRGPQSSGSPHQTCISLSVFSERCRRASFLRLVRLSSHLSENPRFR
jgi:hypothetical protein